MCIRDRPKGSPQAPSRASSNGSPSKDGGDAFSSADGLSDAGSLAPVVRTIRILVYLEGATGLPPVRLRVRQRGGDRVAQLKSKACKRFHERLHVNDDESADGQLDPHRFRLALPSGAVLDDDDPMGELVGEGESLWLQRVSQEGEGHLEMSL